MIDLRYDHIVHLVETAYDADLHGGPWQEAMLSGLCTIVRAGSGAFLEFVVEDAKEFRLVSLETLTLRGSSVCLPSPNGWIGMPSELTSRLFGRSMAISIRSLLGNIRPESLPAWRDSWRAPVIDNLGLVMRSPTGAGALVVAGTKELIDIDKRRRRRHARRSSHDPEKALEIWQGLIAGRWSLVDFIDTDGKRLVLAMKNAPHVARSADLTPRERRVTALAAMGHRDKEIAYMLGLSSSSVTGALRRARNKLGVLSRAELATLWRRSSDV